MTSKIFFIFERWVVVNMAPPVLNDDRPVRRAKAIFRAARTTKRPREINIISSIRISKPMMCLMHRA
ncbi:MAG: hypothetical protein QMC83_02185 [Thermodesulfovibrionales bacterium]|nr:hypothetical protein [Thermodesulfovibrionales bacterium]